MQSVPPPHPVGQVHVLAFQQIAEDFKGVVITTYDSELRQNTPFSAAAILLRTANPDDLVESAGKTRDFSTLPGVICNAWHWGHELSNVRNFRAEHDFGFSLTIHRPFLADRDDTDRDDATNLMQTSASPVCSSLDAIQTFGTIVTL